MATEVLYSSTAEDQSNPESNSHVSTAADAAGPATTETATDAAQSVRAPDLDLEAPSQLGLVNGNSPDLLLDHEAPPPLSPFDSADFLLHPVEVEKGRRAAENFLSSLRNDESRAKAEEALDTLATVISDGKCDKLEFPWQQVRSYHGAAAVTMLKEKGAPARIEALLCRRDSTRSYRMVPDSYPPRQVQKIRKTLTRVIEECSDLGFVTAETATSTTDKPGAGKTSGKATAKGTRAKAKGGKTNTTKKATGGRSLSTGELRALMATCATPPNTEGLRDAVLFALVHRGLKIAEITALRTDSVGVNNKTGGCHIIVRPASGGRARKIELTNEEVIYLEDWLDIRGADEGPLLCTLARGGKIEGKRLTIAALKEICEARGREAQVQPFSPNDLSRSATHLVEHRKAARRKKSPRQTRDQGTEASGVLFESREASPAAAKPETIRFPFLGLAS